MADDLKFCRDCRWYLPREGLCGSEHLRRSPVTGKQFTDSQVAIVERSTSEAFGDCGPSGKHWEAPRGDAAGRAER